MFPHHCHSEDSQDHKKKRNTIVVYDLDDTNIYLVINDAGIEHDDWIIDFASFYYITPNRDCFYIYKPVTSGTIYLRDNSEYHVIGIGIVKVKSSDNSVVAF